MPEFETRTPRKRPSCHFPHASVSTPKTSRIRLKIVKTLPRTMLALRAARRRRLDRSALGQAAGRFLLG
jgi:hypothetical protein